MHACLCFVFFSLHALPCIQLTFAAQNHPKKRRQGTARVGVVACVRSPPKRLTNANPLAGAEKKKKKVLLSSGNDQMIPVHVTKSSSGRSDSCTKSYLTSKNPSSQSGFLLGPLMKIQQRDPGATRGEVLEGLPEAAARLMRSPQIDGGRQTPAKFR